MNVSTSVKKFEPVLMSPQDVPLGKVYSWGDKGISFLRVAGGSIRLSGEYNFLPESHDHFGACGPRVQLALKSDLTITYEG